MEPWKLFATGQGHIVTHVEILVRICHLTYFKSLARDMNIPTCLLFV